MLRRALLVLLFVLVAIAGCGERTRADDARDALLQVEGGQFFRDAMPNPAGGPRVLTTTLSARARAGMVAQGCVGELDSAATAVAIALAGDVGYWVLPASIPQASAPSSPTFTIAFALATHIRPGPHRLVLRAVDEDGRFGPEVVRPLEVVGPLQPDGRLVISLRWNNQADLDLHVLLPSGIEIFKRNRTEYQRPPASAGPVDPNAPTDGGVLDRDSNAMCVPDGQRAENVIWTEAPPKGHYVVRVDTFSLCGAPSAYWRAEAVLDGRQIAAAQGVSTDYDAQFAHNRGDGALAFDLDVP